MTADAKSPPGFSLKRWSQRKLEAARAADPKTATAPPAASAANAARAVPAAGATAAPATAAPPQLPDVGTLTFESDFSAFFQPKVDESLKRAALRKLFSDPRFNVMDGLDTYIDDYTKSDPIPPEMLARLVHGRRLLGLPPEAAPGDPGGAVPDAPSAAATVAAAEPQAAAPVAEPDTATSNPAGEPAANDAPDEPAPR